MTRSIRPTRSVRGTRRVAVLLAGAAAAALFVSGCSAGQIAETAIKKPSVPGLNLDGPDNAIQLRNLVVAYSDPAGYASGGNAPILGAIYNTTSQAITVRVTPVTDVGNDPSLVSATSVVLAPAATASPEATPEPTGTASPSEPASPAPTQEPATPEPQAARPADITIPADGFVMFTESSQETLQVTGLSSALTPGKAVSLRITYEYNGKQQELRVDVPVTTPLSPAPRASSEVAEEDLRGGH